MGYVVWDRLENKPANRTRYQTRKRASRAANRLDLAYGACRYYVKPL